MKYTKCMAITSPSKVSCLVIPLNEDTVLVLLVEIQGSDKIMEILQTLYILPSVLPQSFLEWTYSSFQQSLAEFYTILLEEHLQVAVQMLEAGIYSSLYSLQN
jgi:hypothetical protein